MKLYVTNQLPINIKDHFTDSDIDVHIAGKRPDKKEIIEHCRDAQGIICLLADSIDSEVIDNCPELRIIANYAVGYDNIDIEYARKKGIVVTNTPDVLTETTADLAFGLLIAGARRIVEADEYTRAGNFKGWRPDEMLGTDVHSKTLGIFGFGRIGQAVARRGLGFNMDIIYSSRHKKTVDFESGYVNFDTLVSRSDFISINAPLTDQTYHRFDYNTFSAMKDEAVIINTARGKIINEEDLVRALKEKTIRCACLDVYENEPEIQGELKHLDNVILTPHAGSASLKTRREMAEICINAVKDVLVRGKEPDVCVNC
ncbi:MAG: D-glycerate dehydrogenase [candidate division WOR-3 bacterium]|nr:D-glycerate dehydrogenase [candidate division WOR-3 bacterium]